MDYREYFASGLWHVHTHYTDGHHSVGEVCHWANRIGFKLICFSEHIRREPNYDVRAFLNDIVSATTDYPNLCILSGIEARILPGGLLDCMEEILRQVDIVFLAEHGYPEDIHSYFATLKKALCINQVQVWAHPLLLPHKKGWTLSEEQITELANLCTKNTVVIENNRRYPYLDTLATFRNYPNILNGFDLHDLSTVIQQDISRKSQIDT